MPDRCLNLDDREARAAEERDTIALLRARIRELEGEAIQREADNALEDLIVARQIGERDETIRRLQRELLERQVESIGPATRRLLESPERKYPSSGYPDAFTALLSGPDDEEDGGHGGQYV